ncbi:MAG: BrnT family toxin [Deltaproteobacteria bacterium]
MGQTPSGEILTVVHTYRKIPGEERIRIISARKATKKEMQQYLERRG